MHLGIPPPFPFCEQWPDIPRQSSTWLTPSFCINPCVEAHADPILFDPTTTPRQRVSPKIRRAPDYQNTALERADGYESSEYEYGYELNEEWAEYFVRRENERKLKKKRSKKKKTIKPATSTQNESVHPLSYEISIGQLKYKELKLPSARIETLERRMEHEFMNEFSNPVTVCLYNS